MFFFEQKTVGEFPTARLLNIIKRIESYLLRENERKERRIYWDEITKWTLAIG